MQKIERNILAEGEHTGHFHAANGEGVAVFDPQDNSGERLIVADSPFSVDHQEHNTIKQPAGRYRSRIVREFDPIQQQVRNVLD